jgi:diguanylate cyclase (GGDEF)-like protein/PAS domain S-box-containing protein
MRSAEASGGYGERHDARTTLGPRRPISLRGIVGGSPAHRRLAYGSGAGAPEGHTAMIRRFLDRVAGDRDRGQKAETLDQQRVRLLYRLAPGGALVSLAVATMVVPALWPVTDRARLLGWYGLVFTLVAGTFLLVRAYGAAQDRARQHARWENRAAAAAALHGAGWGTLILVPTGAAQLPHVLTLVVIAGSALGAIGTVGASPRTFFAFVAPLLAVPAVHVLTGPGPLYLPMALLTLALGVIVTFVSLVHHRTLRVGLRRATRSARLVAEQRALFDNAGVGIVTIREDRIADCNRRFAELVGAERATLLGEPIVDWLGDHAGWREARASLGGVGAPLEGLREDLPVRRRDATFVWCDVSMNLVSPHRPGEGIVAFFVDITARKRADAELHRALAEQQAIFDASSAGIALVRDMKLVNANRRMAELFGYPPEALVGLPLRDLFASETDWLQSFVHAEAQFVEGRSFEQEVRLVQRDRTELWCLLQGRAIRPLHLREGLILLFSDVTERKRAEAQLRESEQRLDLVVSAAQNGIWDWDIASGNIYFSPRFKEIVGYPADADMKQLFLFARQLHPDDRQRVLSAQQRTLEKLVPFDEEYRLGRADGTHVWVRGTGRAVAGPGGRARRFVGAISDISDRKAVEEQLRESETHFRRLVETSNDLIWEIDADRRWTYLSPRAARQLLGRESESLVGRPVTETQSEEERARTNEMLDRVLAGEMVTRFQTMHLDSLGARIALSFNATPVRDVHGRVRGATGTATDISERLAREAQLADALAEQELIFEAASEGIVFEKDGLVRKCNGMFASMLGYAPGDLVGQLTSVWFADPSEYERTALAAERRIRTGQVYERELRVRRKNGEVFWCGLRGQGVRPGSLEEGAIWVYSDISERKASEERIRHLAHHDALTGLPNRRLLEDRLTRALMQARRGQTYAAVMLIDLDGFKAVNDGYGHRTGDRVLAAVGQRLRRCVRETDTVARVGGDEFVVVLTEQRTPENAATIAEKIITTVAETVTVGEAQFAIGASIGISVYPRDGLTPEDLLKHADTAMYRVKEAGKNRFQFYRSEGARSGS